MVLRKDGAQSRWRLVEIPQRKIWRCFTGWGTGIKIEPLLKFFGHEAIVVVTGQQVSHEFCSIRKVDRLIKEKMKFVVMPNQPVSIFKKPFV